VDTCGVYGVFWCCGVIEIGGYRWVRVMFMERFAVVS
jgi:hypothetical protein